MLSANSMPGLTFHVSRVNRRDLGLNHLQMLQTISTKTRLCWTFLFREFGLVIVRPIRFRGTHLNALNDIIQHRFRGMLCNKRSLLWTLYTDTEVYFPLSKIGSYHVAPSRTYLRSTSQTYLEHLDQMAVTCNYTNYVSTYVTYPPKGLLPLPGDSVEYADGCDVWSDAFNAALIINPAFNIYRIWDTASNEALSIHKI